MAQDAVDHAGLCNKGWERQKFPVRRESAIGDKAVAMRVEVRSVSAVSLDRQDAAGAKVGAAEQRLISFQYRGVHSKYYPYFGAQMMAFALTFLLVWRLVPETGPEAAKPAFQRAG